MNLEFDLEDINESEGSSFEIPADFSRLATLIACLNVEEMTADAAWSYGPFVDWSLLDSIDDGQAWSKVEPIRSGHPIGLVQSRPVDSEIWENRLTPSCTRRFIEPMGPRLRISYYIDREPVNYEATPATATGITLRLYGQEF